VYVLDPSSKITTFSQIIAISALVIGLLYEEKSVLLIIPKLSALSIYAAIEDIVIEEGLEVKVLDVKGVKLIVEQVKED